MILMMFRSVHPALKMIPGYKNINLKSKYLANRDWAFFVEFVLCFTTKDNMNKKGGYIYTQNKIIYGNSFLIN